MKTCLTFLKNLPSFAFIFTFTFNITYIHIPGFGSWPSKSKKKMVGVLPFFLLLAVGLVHAVSDEEIKQGLINDFGEPIAYEADGRVEIFEVNNYPRVKELFNQERYKIEKSGIKGIRYDLPLDNGKITTEVKVIVNPLLSRVYAHDSVAQYSSILSAAYFDGDILLKPLGMISANTEGVKHPQRRRYMGFVYEKTVGDLASPEFFQKPPLKQVQLIKEAVSNIKQLHNQDYTHGDLTAENVKIRSSEKAILADAPLLMYSTDEKEKLEEFEHFMSNLIDVIPKSRSFVDLRTALLNSYDGLYHYDKVLYELEKYEKRLKGREVENEQNEQGWLEERLHEQHEERTTDAGGGNHEGNGDESHVWLDANQNHETIQQQMTEKEQKKRNMLERLKIIKEKMRQEEEIRRKSQNSKKDGEKKDPFDFDSTQKVSTQKVGEKLRTISDNFWHVRESGAYGGGGEYDGSGEGVDIDESDGKKDDSFFLRGFERDGRDKKDERDEWRDKPK